MIDPATGKVRSFREVDGDKHSLAGRTIASLLVDDKGQLWVGSLSGISRLDHIGPQGAQFQRYGLRDGLPDNTIDCMLEDAEGRIWFSTNLGLGRLDPKTGSVRSFGTADGTQGNEYNSGACLRTAEGILLFGGHGFDIINPAWLQSPPQPAPLVFTAFDAGKQQATLPNSLSQPLMLGPGDRSVQATFSALDYTASTRNRYRYRLLGSRHPEWVGPTTDHTVAYADLVPGDYRLEVQSVLRDGAPGNSASLRFHIPVVWW